MTDTVIKGTGNSRLIKGATNIPSTWDAYRAQLISSGILVDIGNLQSSGVSTMGTALNKANVLPNDTCTALGIATSSVPKDAFNKLATLVKTAQDSADAAQETANLVLEKAYMRTGSYLGTGSPITLFFDFTPTCILIRGTRKSDGSYGMVALAIYPSDGAFLTEKMYTQTITSVSWGVNQITLNNTIWLSTSDNTYYYAAFG